MKKILFVIYALNNGGAERSLVNLLTEIDSNKYEIDLLLFAKEGMFLEQVPDNVNIVQGPKVLETLYTQKKENKNAKLKVYKYMATAMSHICEKGLQAQNAYRWIKFYSKITPRLEKKYDLAIAYISRDIMYYVDVLDALPDERYLKIMYWASMHKKLNLSNPTSFNEKIQWLKLHDRKPEYTQMVDKYEAKKYVADRIV